VRPNEDVSTKQGVRAAAQDAPHPPLKRPRSNPHKPTWPRAGVSRNDAADMGTRCWNGRRPGGSVAAIRQQGSQAYLSLPPRCNGVSQYRQCIRPTSQLGIPRGRERWDGTRREPAKFPPHLSYRKSLPVTGRHDGSGSLGLEEAPRGLWISLNDSGVASIPQFAAALRQRLLSRREAHTYVQAPRGPTGAILSPGAPAPAPKLAQPATEKVPEQSGSD